MPRGLERSLRAVFEEHWREIFRRLGVGEVAVLGFLHEFVGVLEEEGFVPDKIGEFESVLVWTRNALLDLVAAGGVESARLSILPRQTYGCKTK